jgi:hypothetical protein
VLRGLILVFLGVAVVFLALPFLMTSRALEERGITIPGRITHKSETVAVRYSDWERSRDATIEYEIPETGGVSYFDIHPDVPQYDSLHTGQAVEVRYLRRRDVPQLPMTGFLRELHALPMVRAVNLREGSRVDNLFHGWGALAFKIMGGLAVLLVLWRITRSSVLGWATVIGVAAGVGLLLLQGFPRPTVAPAVEVRHGSGRVTNVGRIEKLFSGARQRGVIADQPVDVVAVEFVPEGKTEAVVAVDLIDSGSVRGLKEESPVTLAYEAGSPRTARIDGATRLFPERNSKGLVVQGVLSVALLAGAIALWHWIGRAFRRLTAR